MNQRLEDSGTETPDGPLNPKFDISQSEIPTAPLWFSQQVPNTSVVQMLLFIALPLLCLVAGFSPTVVRAEMLVQACFSPAGECSAHILDAVDSANHEVLVAMYAFTSMPLAQALVRAQERGVEVRVILDAQFDAKSRNSVSGFLAAGGIPIAQVGGLARPNLGVGLMHQKFVVVDRVTIASGSYNWTHSADKFNHENLLIFRSAGPLANEFRGEFLRLWNEQE